MAVVNGAHSDNVNQQFSIIGVIGTSGTADVGGTALTLPIGVDQDTGAMYVNPLINNNPISSTNPIPIMPPLVGYLKVAIDQTDSNNVVDVKAISTIYNGTKTAPTVTAEAIATTQAIRSVTIKALSTNNYPVYVGATGVTTSNGIELLSGESVSLDIADLASVFVISTNASQVIRYIAI